MLIGALYSLQLRVKIRVYLSGNDGYRLIVAAGVKNTKARYEYRGRKAYQYNDG